MSDPRLTDFIKHVRCTNPERIQHDMGRYQNKDDVILFTRCIRKYMAIFLASNSYLTTLLSISMYVLFTSVIDDIAHTSVISGVISVVISLSLVLGCYWYQYLRRWKYLATDFVHLVEMLYILSHIHKDGTISTDQVSQMTGLVMHMRHILAMKGYSKTTLAGMRFALPIIDTCVWSCINSLSPENVEKEALFSDMQTFTQEWCGLLSDVIYV